MSLIDDQLKEELQIAKEQDASGTSLSSESFTKPIQEITMPPVIALDEKTNLGDVVKLMQEKHIGSVVLTNGGELTGIFTERDLLMKVVGLVDNWRDTPVREVMTKGPQTLRASDEVAYILNNMHVGGYRHVPIVDENDRPVAMVSIKDVVRWILDFFPQEITNLTGEPFRGKHKREGA